MSSLSRSALAQKKIYEQHFVEVNMCAKQTLSPAATNNVNIINQKLDNLSQRLYSLEKSVASILDVVNSLANTARVTSPVEFPMESLSAVEEMEQKIQQNTEKYIAILRSALMPEGIVRNLRRVLGRTLIMEFNYAGAFSKNALSSFEALNAALYEAVKKDGYTFSDYIKDVRLAFSKAKNLVYKAKTDLKNKKRRMEQIFLSKEEAEEPEFSVELIEIEEPAKKKRKSKKKNLKPIL